MENKHISLTLDSSSVNISIKNQHYFNYVCGKDTDEMIIAPF